MKFARPKILINESLSIKWIDRISFFLFLGNYIIIIYKSVNLSGLSPANKVIDRTMDSWRNELYLLIIFTLLTFGIYKIRKFPHLFNYPVSINEQNALYHYSKMVNLVAYIQLLISFMAFVDVMKYLGNSHVNESSFYRSLLIYSDWIFLVCIISIMIITIIKKIK